MANTINVTTEAFAEELRKALTERIEAEIKITHVQKNNGLCLTGLIIKDHDTNIAPTIYLEKFFEEYDGVVSEEAIEEIIDCYNRSKVSDIDVSFFSDWEQVKSLIHMRLVNLEKNAKRLAELPHMVFGDLAIIFAVDLVADAIGHGSITVRNEHLKCWDKTTEDLYEVSKENKEETVVKSIIEVLTEMGDIPEEFLPPLEEAPMFVASNPSRFYGAIALADLEALKDFARKMGSFYIIPSSVHELIFVPCSMAGCNSEDYLSDMVNTVNTESVEDDEVLGVHTYYFDAETDTLFESCFGNEMTINVA